MAVAGLTAARRGFTVAADQEDSPGVWAMASLRRTTVDLPTRFGFELPAVFCPQRRPAQRRLRVERLKNRLAPSFGSLGSENGVESIGELFAGDFPDLVRSRDIASGRGLVAGVVQEDVAHPKGEDGGSSNSGAVTGAIHMASEPLSDSASPVAPLIALDTRKGAALDTRVVPPAANRSAAGMRAVSTRVPGTLQWSNGIPAIGHTPKTQPGGGGHIKPANADSVYLNLQGQPAGTTSSNAIVPIDAGNTNGSPRVVKQGVVQVGIPSVRDFNASPLPTDDPQIVGFGFSGAGEDATFSVSYTSTGTGDIRLWADGRKSVPFGAPYAIADATQGLPSVCVEGIKTSSTVGDITLTTALALNSGPIATYTLRLSVTPVVQSLQVIPRARDATQNNVEPDPAVPVQGQSQTIRTWTVDGQGRNIPGVTLKAQVYGAVPGVNFLQNVEKKEKSVNGTGAGIIALTSTSNPKYELKEIPGPEGETPLSNHKYPAVDTSPGAKSSLYGYSLKDIDPQDSNRLTYYGSDSPGQPFSLNRNDYVVTSFDIKTTDRSYLVCVFNDGSCYAVAYNDWVVNLFATTPVGGNLTVNPAAGVIASSGVLASVDP